MSSPVPRSWPTSTIWWARPRPGSRWCGPRRRPTEMDGVTGAMVNEDGEARGRYIVVKALEDGVVIMGLTRGKDTRSHHSERLDAGEGMVAQFTELTAAIKIRGRAEILTAAGGLASGVKNARLHTIAGFASGIPRRCTQSRGGQRVFSNLWAAARP